MTEQTPTALPRFTLNGSPRSHLMKPLLSALLAIDGARTTLAECCPHGRDYSDVGLSVATRQHRLRMQQLNTMHAELMELAVHIDQSWPASMSDPD